MTDLRIQYNEEMVGANHSTKSDTLNRLALAEHNTDGSHAVANESIRGLVVSRSDDANLAISAGWVVIDDGAGVQRRALPSNTTKAHGQGGAAVVYVYIDPDAASGGTAPALNNNNIIVSTTAPVWVTSKQGLYHPSNTGQRCVGCWITDGSGNSHTKLTAMPDGETVFWKEEQTICTTQNNTSFTYHSLANLVPAVAYTITGLIVIGNYVSAGGTIYLREYGVSGNGVFQVMPGSGVTPAIIHTMLPVRLSGTDPRVNALIDNAGSNYSIRVEWFRLKR